MDYSSRMQSWSDRWMKKMVITRRRILINDRRIRMINIYFYGGLRPNISRVRGAYSAIKACWGQINRYPFLEVTSVY